VPVNHNEPRTTSRGPKPARSLSKTAPAPGRCTPGPDAPVAVPHAATYPRPVTVLIDPPRWPAHGRVWSHLVSDSSYQELHDFAATNGIPQRGFDHDHYDVPDEKYEVLIEAGAVPVDSRELLRRIGAAGLRQPKRDRRPGGPARPTSGGPS
jgi:hypothetical protein